MTPSATPPRPAGFDELALFVDIAAAGSITAAARRLGLPKSTVSRALTRLEQKLGVALMRRASRGRSLTEPGEELLATLAPHVTGMRDATMALGRASDEPYGTLRVTAPIDLGEHFLAPLLPEFLARHPRMQVQVDLSARFVDLIGEGVDVALRVTTQSLASSSLRARKLAVLHLALFAAPAYLARHRRIARPADLTGVEHVLFRSSRGLESFVIAGPEGTLSLPVRNRIEGNDFHFVRAALVAGGGVGALPWLMAAQDVAAGRLVRVLPRYRVPGATAYLLHAPAKPLPRKVEVFRDHLLAHVALLTECG